MRIDSFEQIEAWKGARKLVREVYTKCSCCRDFGFRDQIQRASISVMSNIAEGFDRGSNKEFIQFLVIARGSASEVKSLTYAGQDIGHFTSTEFDELTTSCTNVSSMINGFIRYLKSTDRKC